MCTFNKKLEKQFQTMLLTLIGLSDYVFIFTLHFRTKFRTANCSDQIQISLFMTHYKTYVPINSVEMPDNVTDKT